MAPRISIIVPVYNVEDVLKYCTDSLLAQSFSDYEILLIDDGSKDRSGQLCDEIAKKDFRIRVYHKQNGGLSDARNYGIDKAIGENYLFIDSDDILHKDFCKVLIDLQDKYGAEICSTSLVDFFDINEISVLNAKSYKANEFVFTKAEALKEYYTPADGTKIFHGLCMKLYKKELFQSLRFEKGRLHEDLYITYKLLNQCNSFAFVDLPYYYYYQKNSNSITKNYKEKNLVDEYDAVQLMLKYFENDLDTLSYVRFFAQKHYLYLLDRTFSLPKSQCVLEKRGQIKDWFNKNLELVPNLTKKRKLEIIIKVRYRIIYKILVFIKLKVVNVK